ncbi:uncharacterized protein LOC113469304 [Diaphorina citri]|uniref:Uncharacterized protein LOC113469304 n=1 Tax=Diaphorina citri TaxID=121845 RepID=A0A3Q0J7K0_DIACI|nr:uncharacterized protein LOC113469304 [Diaphorina citri]
MALNSKPKSSRWLIAYTNIWFKTSWLDKNKAKKLKLRSKADSDTAGEIGAPMPGNIIEVKVKVGQQVKKNDVLIVMSVMKTETLIHASADGVVKEIFVEVGGQVAQNDLVVVLDVGEVKLK